MLKLKQSLYQACQTYINNRIRDLEEAIKLTQQAANEETKSTAGDKYETGRAMAQLEIEKYHAQLAEAMRIQHELLRIPVELNEELIKPGSLVFTSRGNFYLSVQANQISIQEQIFHTVSLSSPLAQKLIGLRLNDTFILNMNEFRILKIQ